jgi:hypothetical protein
MQRRRVTGFDLPPVKTVDLRDTHRLIPSRYPPIGLLDAVAAPEDLPLLIVLAGWTDDQVTAELGVLRTIPEEEWVVGRPYSAVVMNAFCHPRLGGGRFNNELRGAWYAAFDLATAHAEIVFHRTAELLEIGVLDARIEMRLYLADFAAVFHDLRGGFAECHDPHSYAASQLLARELLDQGSNGILYDSVRRAGGECIGCFRPRLVGDVRAAEHYEYVWAGRREPRIRRCGTTRADTAIETIT